VRLADKIKKVEDHHLLELIRDTHKPAASATPLFEPLPAAVSAAANAAAQESPRPFPLAPQTNAFGVPLPAHAEHHHEQQQQEDYLWGV
jgi:hypothetical protein